MLSSLIATVVSSAKIVKFDGLEKDGSSFIYTRISNGPNILPWSTPIVKFFNVELLPFKLTYCFVCDK